MTKENETEITDKQDTHKFIVFSLDDEDYGIDLDHIEEIIRHITITNVPSSPEDILGVTKVRDEIIPVIDIKNILGIGQMDDDRDEVIIMAHGDRKFAAPVDHVKNIISPDTTQLVDPLIITNLQTDLLSWIVKLGGNNSVRIIHMGRVFEKIDGRTEAYTEGGSP